MHLKIRSECQLKKISHIICFGWEIRKIIFIYTLLYGGLNLVYFLTAQSCTMSVQMVDMAHAKYLLYQSNHADGREKMLAIEARKKDLFKQNRS